MHPIIIIGSGLAGYTLAREFRKLDKETAVTLITADDGTSYSKPMLSNALSKQKNAASLAMASTEKMANDLSLKILTNTSVIKINPDKNTIETDQGNLEYSQLVFATGARPIKIPFAGNGARDILSINNLDDYKIFREKLANKKRVAILGPGLIGCEFANDLIGSGYEVSVIGPDKFPLQQMLPGEAGQSLQKSLADFGVDWYLETLTSDISINDSAYTLAFESGKSITVDLVLSAVGLKPDTKLAAAADITVNRGIMVNRYLQTSVQNIFALGDCMEIEDLVLPFVMPIMFCARALASTLSGTRAQVSFPAMPVVVKTPAHPIVICPPHPRHDGHWQLVIEADKQGVKACYYNKQKLLLGFTLTGDKISEKQSLTKLLPAYLE
ncbi:MAG: FAD-dependent oxidoreductase [Acidiferrobacterales bacterium]